VAVAWLAGFSAGWEEARQRQWTGEFYAGAERTPIQHAQADNCRTRQHDGCPDSVT
jgi:hypothetical protein